MLEVQKRTARSVLLGLWVGWKPCIMTKKWSGLLSGPQWSRAWKSSLLLPCPHLSRTLVGLNPVKAVAFFSVRSLLRWVPEGLRRCDRSWLPRRRGLVRRLRRDLLGRRRLQELVPHHSSIRDDHLHAQGGEGGSGNASLTERPGHLVKF